ncbi:hypothetical protein IAE22_33295, partial [Bacillus sp. S34]|nr:hypothetical protein [Bacillus sp. S34]
VTPTERAAVVKALAALEQQYDATVGIVAIAVGVANGNAMCGPFDEDGVLEACPGDTSGIVWGSVLGVVGLLHLGLTGLAGALVWTSSPTIGPKPVVRPAPVAGATPR